MSEAHIAIRFGKLKARVARLESFARRYVRCPCCDHDRRCDPECEHLENAPEQHAEMVAAREALYGEEVENGK